MILKNMVSEGSDFSKDYEKQVREYGSYAGDVLFGMSFEFVKPDERLLDIGIGTGLASIPFSRLGLKISGLDSSQEMLDACRSESFTEALTLWDISGGTLPCEDGCFDHVISCGVLHFLGDLQSLFREVQRVMRPGGIFSFTIAPADLEGPFEKENTAWDIPIYRHSMPYIRGLLTENSFLLEKEQRMLIKGADKVNYNMLFSALVARGEGP